jgi:alkylation response protein AidB-like acyl-CoA dehydrogenase
VPNSSIYSTFQQVARRAGAMVPLPGSGHTWRRFEELATWAATDLSLGRLAEGHVDALAILAEAGMRRADPMATYGVWAARSTTGGTVARREEGGWKLSGQKAFCSGSGLIDRALLTADTDDGYRLFDISVNEQVTARQSDSWRAVGMADSASETLEFGGPPVPAERMVGAPGFYLGRPGFWFGAVGVAACWYGGALGLVDHLRRAVKASSSALVLADVGQAAVQIGIMRRVLEQAATEIDEDPGDTKGGARSRALVVRHAVHHCAAQVLGFVASAGGASPLCHDREQGQRAADLYVYLAQHHRSQDAAELGRLAVEGLTWT